LLLEVVKTLLPLAETLVIAGFAAIVAFAGRKLSVSKLKLPFIDFELLDKERPDRFELSIIMAETSYEGIEDLEKLAKTKNADLLIYFGWHIVCDTYVNRYLSYPSDNALDGKMAELGAQNVEFIKIYRTTYERNILGGGLQRVEPDYALNYFSRSLSLAERIDHSAQRDHGPRIRRLLSRLSTENLPAHDR
jgi:hypothetical protein